MDRNSSEPPSTHTSIDDADADVAIPRDAGGGKVRGPNGRYLPTSKPSSAQGKTRIASDVVGVVSSEDCKHSALSNLNCITLTTA